jgi:rSAM/selenodomain-associated transferase 2
MPPTVSVVIPALDEARHIEACIRSIRSQEGVAEIIVVDGGSTDGTATIALRFAEVLVSEPGRALQMNAGAARATGDALLFVHADSTLHPAAIQGVRRALLDPRTVGGTFTLRFDHGHPLLRFYALCSRLRVPLFHYGDQGIFLRRGVFEALGGFPQIPLMEDLELLRRLRRYGRVTLVPSPVTTSARRFLARGVARQQLLNIALVAAYLLGARPERLARWYTAVVPPGA